MLRATLKMFLKINGLRKYRISFCFFDEPECTLMHK